MEKSTTNQRSKRRVDATKTTTRIEPGSSIFSLNFILCLAAISALIVGIYIQLTINLSEKLNQSSSKNNLDDILVLADNLEAGYLDHVVDTMLKYDHKLKLQNFDSIQNKPESIEQYDTIWSHDYPFQVIKKLRPTQRVNHFPGIGFITNKATLSTSPKLPNLLKAFILPMEKEKFIEYSSKNPHKQWIQKSSSHRGISVETADTVNLNLNDTIVQEFLSNPLLIEGKKFDIGIYAVFTSV